MVVGIVVTIIVVRKRKKNKELNSDEISCTLFFALRTYSRKLRTILTIVGVMIGTCAIVVMISLVWP